MHKLKLTAPVLAAAAFWSLSMAANVGNWLFNVMAGRLLTTEEFAVLTVFLSFQYLFSVPANALSTTVSRFTAYYSEKGDQAKHFYFFRQYWWLAWAVGLGAAVLILVFRQAINAFFGFESAYLIFLFALMLVPMFLVAFERGTLSGHLAFIWVGVLYIVEAWTKVAVLWLAPAIPGITLISAVAALPLSVLIAWLVSLVVTRSFHPLPQPLVKETNNKLKETYQFLSNSVFAGIGTVLLFNLDVLLVKHYFPAAEAGVYSTLTLLGKTLYFGAGSLISILIPLTAKAQAKGQSSRKPFWILLGLMTLMGLGIWGAYVLAPYWVVTTLLTERAVVVIPYLSQYALAMLFLVLATCFTVYSLAKENYLPARLTLVAAVVEAGFIFFQHGSLMEVVTAVTWSLLGLLVAVAAIDLLGITDEAVVNNLKSLGRLLVPEKPALANSQEKTDKDNQKIKVLVFSWRDIKHVDAGGAEVYIHEIGKRLVKDNFEVTLFTSNDAHSPARETIDGVNIIRRGGFITVYVWAFLYYWFRFRGKYDVVVDCENGIPFYTPVFVKEPVVLVVHHVHQDVFFKSLIPPFSWIALWLETGLMPRVYRKGAVVAVSPSTAEELRTKIHLMTTDIIANGVDVTAYRPGPKAATPLISFVGRLKKYKSLEVLLAAFKRLTTEEPEARLVIAGDGDYRPVLEKQAHELGLDQRVAFWGKVPETDKIKLLGRSWVMVHPSFMEGWGMTCLEANACGTPVLASRVAGLQDAVSEGVSGYLFTYGDDAELSRQLLALIRDSAGRERLGQTAQAWSHRYSWRLQAEKFGELIRDRLRTSWQPAPALPVVKYEEFN